MCARGNSITVWATSKMKKIGNYGRRPLPKLDQGKTNIIICLYDFLYPCAPGAHNVHIDQRSHIITGRWQIQIFKRRRWLCIRGKTKDPAPQGAWTFAPMTNRLFLYKCYAHQEKASCASIEQLQFIKVCVAQLKTYFFELGFARESTTHAIHPSALERELLMPLVRFDL